MRIIDGDAHFLEPLDLFERYIDPSFREGAMQLRPHPDSGDKQFLVNQKPMHIFDVDAFLGAVAGYGQKEEGQDLNNFDRYLYHAAGWQDMGKRVRFLWVNGDPEEKMFPLIVQFAGDDRFFIGSDYPHAEGFVHPVEKARNVLSPLPPASVDKILGINAAKLYKI